MLMKMPLKFDSCDEHLVHIKNLCRCDGMFVDGRMDTISIYILCVTFPCHYESIMVVFIVLIL